jgi:hypothetical protein
MLVLSLLLRNCRCVASTPLGREVVPLVKKIVALSCAMSQH